jgi:hypothetical protein
MKDFTLAEFGVFIGIVGGVITSLLMTVQKSKCKTIDCCCMKCDRDPTLKTDGATPRPSPTKP